MHRLQTYRWPGNIRELENFIERAIILTDSPMLEIDNDQLPSAADCTVKSGQTSDASLDSVAKEHILTILKQTGWIIEGPKGATQMLNLKPSTLHYRMQKLGIHKTDS